jgi:hypothetical protein
MDALSATRGRRWPNIASPAEGQLVRAVVDWLFALLAIMALVVCVRRSGGSLVEPLDPAILWGWGALLGLIAVMFRRVHLPASRRGSAKLYAIWAAPSLVVGLWVAGLSLRETGAGGLAGLWSLLFFEEVWSWSQFPRIGTVSQQTRPPASIPQPDEDDSAAPDVDVIDRHEDELSEAVSQRLVRSRQADGTERIEGWVRADFAPRQRYASAHVAICPPLDRVPTCFAEPLDGPPAQVKVAHVVPYGVRFEIKLDAAADEATSVVVEFAIQQSAEA